MILILLLLCGSIILLYHFYRFAKYVQLINNIPSVPSRFLLGHIELLGSQEDVWKFQRSLCKNYYPIYKVWCGPLAMVSIHHPDDLEKILGNSKEHLSKGYMYAALYPWLRTGLLTSEGTKWRTRRKILTPAFHFNILKEFSEIIINEANNMTKSLKEMNGSTVDNLILFVSHYALNTICETAMGTCLQEMNGFQHTYREAIFEMGKIVTYRVLRPWLISDTIFALTSMGRKHSKYLKILHNFTKTIIEERKQYHENTGGQYLNNFENNDTDKEELGIKKKRLAMLDLLILAARDNKIDDIGIMEEVDTFMFEGHDTVTMGLTFAILVIAEHKDIQECIRDEVSAVIQANGGKLSMLALNDMPYLERCIKESLRLYPSVPFIGRVLSRDEIIHSYLVPQGTIIHLNIFDIHRDPNFWPNPEVFDPDRFLPEQNQNRHPYSYLPFSAGSRNCIGQRFAMLEMKAVMATLIYNFYLEPVDYLKDVQFMIDIITRVTRPIRTRFVPINRS